MSELRTILTGIMLSMLAATGWAAVPGSLNYQGYLTDQTGSAIDADTSITFSIYAVETGGSPLWSETLLVPIDNGLFSVTLGNPVNPFPADLFDTPLYIGIDIAGDGEMVPRRPLTTAAFSFRAEDADTLQGNTAADLDQTDEIALLQANTVLQLDTVLTIGGGGEAQVVAPGGLEAANSATGPDLIVGGLDGSGTGDDGVIASEPSLPGSDLIFQTNDAFVVELDNDGNGEDADFQILDKDNIEIFNIEEDGQVRLHGPASMTAGDDPTFGPVLTFLGESADQVESGRLRFRESSTPTNLRGGYIHYDGAANTMHIGVHDASDNDLANDDDIITIERASGQVGIGTVSPNRELTVNDTNGNGDAVINVTAPGRELIVGVNQGSGGIVGTLSNNDLQLRTNNAARMTIDAAGDVQVANNLHVEGDIRKDYGGAVPGWAAPYAMARVDASDPGNPVFRSRTNNVSSVIFSGSTFFVTLSDSCTSGSELDGYLPMVTPDAFVTGNDLTVSTFMLCDPQGATILVKLQNGFGFFIEQDFNLAIFRIE